MTHFCSFFCAIFLLFGPQFLLAESVSKKEKDFSSFDASDCFLPEQVRSSLEAFRLFLPENIQQLNYYSSEISLQKIYHTDFLFDRKAIEEKQKLVQRTLKVFQKSFNQWNGIVRYCVRSYNSAVRLTNQDRLQLLFFAKFAGPRWKKQLVLYNEYAATLEKALAFLSVRHGTYEKADLEKEDGIRFQFELDKQLFLKTKQQLESLQEKMLEFRNEASASLQEFYEQHRIQAIAK